MANGGKNLKSEATRERIAAAARRVFSTEGFDRTTIRAVADQANIHASMVMRYFGSKEALFAEVVQFDLRLPDLASIPFAERGRYLVSHFLDRWESEDGELAALLRTAVTHPAARNRMCRIFDQQLALSLGEAIQGEMHRERAALIASQMLGLGLTRYVLAFDSARRMDRSTVIDLVGHTIQSYLHADTI